MDNKNARVAIVGWGGQGYSDFAKALTSIRTMRIPSQEEIRKHEIRAEIIKTLTECYGCSYAQAETILENKTLDELERISYKLLEGNVKVVNNELIFLDPVGMLQNYLLDNYIEYKPKKENKKTWKKNKFWE